MNVSDSIVYISFRHITCELTGGFSCIMDAIASDYSGGSAGRTIGSRREAEWTKRSTKLTRTFAPRSGANVASHRTGEDALGAAFTGTVDSSCSDSLGFFKMVKPVSQ